MYWKDEYEFDYCVENEIKFAGKYGAKGEKRQKKRKPTPEQIKKQNQENREKRIRHLLRWNFVKGDYWCTLTFPKGTKMSMEQVLKAVEKFRRNLKNKYKKRGYEFKWIQRIEIGELGGVHVHMVINRIPDADVYITEKWKYGKVYFVHIYEKGGMKKLASYIVKKPTEEIYEQMSLFSEEEQKHLVKYSCSRNLKRKKPKRKFYKRRTLKKAIENGPTPKKGFYIDKNSVVFGTNWYTGMSYLRYTEFRIGYGEDDDGGASEHLYI